MPTTNKQTLSWDSLWTNVHLATLADGDSYGEIPDAAIAVRDGRIAWLGPRAELPAGHDSKVEYDGAGCWLTPGLVDCHTHIVYAGNRSAEFEARLNGASYEDIARSGGGIMSTVRATRAATEQALYDASVPRVRALLAEGVTTLEIKSGYGLDFATEAKMLRVARRIGVDLPVHVSTTFLGAHALPPEYADAPERYLDSVCDQMLPALAAEGLVDAVDAFCEKIGFSAAQTERVFQAAQRHGLPVKLHAEQLSDQGGAALTARYRGLSADHLEYLSQSGIDAMAEAGTVAVLLPGAFYFLRETMLPPLAALRTARVPIALSTDCNPGTSPMTSLLLVMNMACTLFRMTPLEALAGVTNNAAAALGLQHEIGSLAVGKRADFALWAIDRPGDLAYGIGGNPCRWVVNAGRRRGRDAIAADRQSGA
ncbi:imidazolonepropionase [Noviherbaspirillum saxi]|uniref:Imidazolonepropionase n=1 Tax=Noviherbaspirillum saxi TaxID=2320863 RepID=A0A3A3FVJ9_9BURK|nr:imidazolonepropionase [Noviherbaspirillum saxi]RJF99354.1 imidazolonepropionase [Noviherbaspirillum saxi]